MFPSSFFSFGFNTHTRPPIRSMKLTNAGDESSIPRLGRSLGERNNNPLQYSCLGNATDRGELGRVAKEVRHDLATLQ